MSCWRRSLGWWVRANSAQVYFTAGLNVRPFKTKACRLRVGGAGVFAGVVGVGGLNCVGLGEVGLDLS
jgi:hypothetical protein